MFITNGNRRPKPALKHTFEVKQGRSMLRYEIEGLLKPTAYRPNPSEMNRADMEVLLDFHEAHKDKELVAVFGNEIKKPNASGSVKLHVDVSLYALPKDSIQKIERSRGVNPTVHLKSNFIFEDKDVGSHTGVTVLINKKGDFVAYEVEEEAKDALSQNVTSMTSLGRFPFINQDGELYVKLPVTAWHTRRAYLLNQQKEVLPAAIQMTSATVRKKGSIKVEDATRKASQRRQVSIVTDVDINALPDGRYRAVRDDINLWLIKASFNIGTINMTNFLLLAHDNKAADEVELQSLPEEEKAKVF